MSMCAKYRIIPSRPHFQNQTNSQEKIRKISFNHLLKLSHVESYKISQRGRGEDLLSKHSHLSFTIEINYLSGTTGKHQNSKQIIMNWNSLASCLLSVFNNIQRARKAREKKVFQSLLLLRAVGCWMFDSIFFFHNNYKQNENSPTQNRESLYFSPLITSNNTPTEQNTNMKMLNKKTKAGRVRFPNRI